METILESKLNPLVVMGKRGSTKVGGFVNKFNADAELLDDLVNHFIISLFYIRSHLVDPPIVSTTTGQQRATNRNETTSSSSLQATLR